MLHYMPTGMRWMNRRHMTLLVLLFALTAYADKAWWPVPMFRPDTARDSIEYVMEVSAVASSGHTAPSFIHANENGNISAAPFSGNLSAGVIKRATRPSRWFDYDFGVVLTGRFDTERATGYFRQLYAHTRLYIIDVTAGIKPFSVGAQNPSLTMGGLLFSNNAQPVPRISIGIDDYLPFPGLFGYMEIKGGLTHGWFVDANRLDSSGTKGALLHYKFAGVRLGGRLPVNISYEIHHAAQWGGVSPDNGPFDSSWETYKHIFMASSGGSTLSDRMNAQGNHIGFQQLALTAKWTDWNITAYWQNLFEDKSADIIGRSNQEDGMWGLTIHQTQWPFIHSVTYEFLNTTSQNGPWHDRDGLVFGGRSDYYNNSSYRQGWTHFGRTIGNSFMSPRNNRVRTHYAGVAGDIYGYRYRLMGAYTRNWGTPHRPDMSHNTALMLEVKKTVPQAWGLDFGLRLAADFGDQFGNQFGAMITICKQGLIHEW